MDDMVSRFFSELIGREHGPLAFRFILQPVMAAFGAYRAAKKDVELGRAPYFWDISKHHGRERRALLWEGLRSDARVIGLGVVMDVIYQVIVFRAFHPLQTVVIVFVLAFLPFLLLRGPFNRFLRRRMKAHS
jgi:hypothetical protein